jgi:hypothetical protein
LSVLIAEEKFPASTRFRELLLGALFVLSALRIATRTFR